MIDGWVSPTIFPFIAFLWLFFLWSFWGFWGFSPFTTFIWRLFLFNHWLGIQDAIHNIYLVQTLFTVSNVTKNDVIPRTEVFGNLLDDSLEHRVELSDANIYVGVYVRHASLKYLAV